MRNEAILRAYLRAIEDGRPDDEVLAYFTPDAQQVEYPNALTPKTAVRSLDDVRAAAQRGRNVIEAQRYEIRSVLEQGDQVAMEVTWTGRLKVPLGKLAVGHELRAEFGVFFTMRDGKIASQRNYDCFEPL